MQVSEQKLKKVVFFGSDAICLPALGWLKGMHGISLEFLAVVSQPDRRQGRGQKVSSNPVAEFAKENGIQLFQPEKPDKELADWMAGQAIAIGFVMAYGHFIGRSLRESFNIGMYNFHGSVLPKYRGASPVESAIACGEHETGVCLMEVGAQMDSGAVSDIEPIAILKNEDAMTLRMKIGQAVVPILERSFEKLASGQLTFKAQNDSEASYCRKLNKIDGLIDFNLSSEAIYNRWRAFKTWPSSYFLLGDERIKVGSLKIIESQTDGLESRGIEGAIHIKGDQLFVETKDGFIEFLELQKAGGRMLPVADFLRGHHLDEGMIFSGGASQPLIRRH
jgi:methionyl-tRNA formyltransferase